jgi:predicted dehydrogenase
MTSPVSIAVAGAGQIGRRHLEEIDASGSAQIGAIVDPFAAAQEVADTFGVPLYTSPAELFEADKPDRRHPRHARVTRRLPTRTATTSPAPQGSLSVPTMRLKVYEGERSWWQPFESSTIELERSDPLANRVEHFAAVIRGEVEPICSGRDGLTTLLVVDAVLEAARTGAPVDRRCRVVMRTE